EDPHEVAVPELVDGDEPDQGEHRIARRSIAGEERLVLHPRGLYGVEGRHDRGGGPIRVRAQRLREVAERLESGLERDPCGALEFLRVEDLDCDGWATRALVARGERPELVPGGEGEIVDVALHEAVAEASGCLDRRALLFSDRADDVLPRQGDGDVVAAEVRVELGVEMELVTVPPRRGRAPLAGQLEDSDLGKPL